MPKRTDLWADWERIYTHWEDPDHEQHALDYYQEHRKEMHEEVELLWPEREDLYALMRLRATIGTAAFASEKQWAWEPPGASPGYARQQGRCSG
jgi:hypothetical protein